MTQAQMNEGLVIVLTIAYVIGAALLGFVLQALHGIRRDILAAGIDIHQELVEIKVHQRLMVMGKPVTPAPNPLHPAESVGEESPEQWLERQRIQRVPGSHRR
jgi:hypothetical protein